MGAVLNDVTAKGPWAERDRPSHINELELIATLFSLKSFTNLASRVSLRLMMNKITSVHYVNKLGGSRSEHLYQISAVIVMWCEPRAITINAVISSGCAKCNCRSALKGVSGLQRLEAQSSNIQSPESSLEPKSRLVRFDGEQTAGPVCQLGPSTRHNSGRRVQHRLVRLRRLRIPAISSSSEVFDEDNEVENGADVSDSILASLAVVPIPSRTDMRAGRDPAKGKVSVGSGRPAAPAVRVASTNRLEIVRGQYEDSGLSNGVVDLLLGGAQHIGFLPVCMGWLA